MSPRPARIPTAMLLARQPLFRALDAATVARLAQAASRKSLARGEVLFRQGARPTAMYLVVYGHIKLVSDQGTRSERLTGIAGPGRSFAEPVMFLDTPAVVSAIAIDDALVLHLPKAAVMEELERNPAFTRAMLAALSQRVEALVQEISRHSSSTGRDRLLHYLLRQVNAQRPERAIRLAVSKGQLASQLHLTAEHFSRLLHELARDGLVRVRGREIAIPDPGRLEALLRTAAPAATGAAQAAA